jgi:hypothetical protein
MSFPGALDGCKAITYAALIEDYSEANVCLEAALNEGKGGSCGGSIHELTNSRTH